MTTVLQIQNVKCGGCSNSITSALNKMDGISNVQVDVENGEVKFDLDDFDALAKIKTKLSRMGYPEDESTILHSATSYVSCMIGRLKKNEYSDADKIEVK